MRVDRCDEYLASRDRRRAQPAADSDAPRFRESGGHRRSGGSAAPDVVVLCNTGCRVDTVARKLSAADAAVVGTTFKEDGDFGKHVDVARVREFMQAVRDFRAIL